MNHNTPKPKISVLMPVYNVRNYLATAIESVLNQTLHDIELICVDDASTDGSAEILREYAAKDPRVKLVFHKKNSGLVAARRSATNLAEGDYIMLLDSDDEYLPDACQTVWEEEQANPVDILQFGTEPIICRAHSDQEMKDLEKVLTPYTQAKGNLIACCYEQHLWNHTVWNKAYRAEVWKKAVSNAIDAYINISEDEYLLFLVSFFSDTYRGIQKPLYRYYYARGMTGAMGLSAKQYEGHCRRKLIYQELKAFVERNDRADLLPVLNKMEDAAREEMVYMWRYHVVPAEAKEAFWIFVSLWGAVPAVSEAARILWNDMHEVANRLVPDTLPVEEGPGKPVHTIAIFYHRMGNGGVERVISYLIPLWKEMGYSVVLVTESAPSADDYEVPKDVPWVQLPKIADSFGKAYRPRAEGWAKIVEEYNIDTVVYNTANVIPLWDVCLLKALGCNFVVDIHSTFSSLYLLNDPNRFYVAQCYRLVDRVATLSRVFARYWGNFCPAYYIPNPLGNVCDAGDCSALSGRNILWVGRLSEEKRPDHAIHIFKQVHDRFSDATLTIVGKGETPADLARLQTLAADLGVEQSVTFAGYHKDVFPYYQHADVLLFTSQYEGAPLVLFESKMCGVPIVMYNLPYVETVRDKAGIFTAPQGDQDTLARHLIRLLEDGDLRRESGRLARESLADYGTEQLKEKWRTLFDSFTAPHGAYCADEDQRLMMSLLMESEQIAVAQTRAQSGGAPAPVFVTAPLADRLVNSKFQKIAVWYWKHTDPIKEGLKRLKGKGRA